MNVEISFSGLTEWRGGYTQSVRNFLRTVELIVRDNGGKVDNVSVKVSLTTNLTVDSSTGRAYPAINPQVAVKAVARSLGEDYLDLPPKAGEEIAGLMAQMISVIDPVSAPCHKLVEVDLGYPSARYVCKMD